MIKVHTSQHHRGTERACLQQGPIRRKLFYFDLRQGDPWAAPCRRKCREQTQSPKPVTPRAPQDARACRSVPMCAPSGPGLGLMQAFHARLVRKWMNKTGLEKDKTSPGKQQWYKVIVSILLRCYTVFNSSYWVIFSICINSVTLCRNGYNADYFGVSISQMRTLMPNVHSPAQSHTTEPCFELRIQAALPSPKF